MWVLLVAHALVVVVVDACKARDKALVRQSLCWQGPLDETDTSNPFWKGSFSDLNVVAAIYL